MLANTCIIDTNVTHEQAATDIPQHVGYIVDGNRRWAKRHGLPSYEGHLAGYEALKEVVFGTFDSGVQFVSVFAFSTENWRRTEGEVKHLMRLAMRVFRTDLKQFINRGLRIRLLGTREGLSEKLLTAAEEAEAQTVHLTKGTICVCFNYGGQREIVDAARTMAEQNIPVEELTVENFARHLYAPDVPPVDVVVRTSGEQRLSNFMLWRAAYAEFIFLEKCWPDMRTGDVHGIMEEYARRGRRWGS